ncbi:MAG: hypothetical protein RL094_455 [Candidatus Parcubacteria bacterium]|jgi:hypothetical protein
MTIPEILGLLSGIFLIAGYIPYMYEVLKGTDIPNRASWFIWSLSTITILIGVRETGTNEAIWVPIADAIGCFIIFILSIRKGTGGWNRTDKISLAFAAVSLALWAFTGNILVALITNLAIYTSGYISTIKKSIDDPKSESFVAWTMFFMGVVLNLVTVIIGTDTGFAVWLYPIVLVATVGTLYAVLFRRFKNEIPA